MCFLYILGNMQIEMVTDELSEIKLHYVIKYLNKKIMS